MELDHIVLGVADLEAGIARLEALTGVRPVRGGEHPELGTHNALISLGPRQYLEVMAPRPGVEVAEAFRFLENLEQLTPVTWAVATGNAEETAGRLAAAGHTTSEIVPGSRIQANGQRLEWRMFLLAELGIEGPPFFIEWSPRSPHPAGTAPSGCRLESIALGHPEAARLAEIFTLLGLRVPVFGNPSPRLQVRIGCPSGAVAW